MEWDEKHNLEEAIGWNVMRATVDAAKNMPEIPLEDDLFVEVLIRVRSDSWPGETKTGRSKTTLIGQGSCLYRRRK